MREAQTQYEIAVQLDPYGPGNKMAYFLLAEVLLKANDQERAADCVETYVKLHPDDVQGWIQLAHVRGKMGDWTKAEMAAEKAVAMSPQSPLLRQFLEQIRAHRLPQ